jgi:hypothetical protein
VYDIQSNIAGSSVDSRLVSRSGFKVDTSNKNSGLQVGDGDQADITEAVESCQAVMNLAAASVKHGFDLFLTYTCNQATHPGIRKLHEFKQSMKWTDKIEGYQHMAQWERNDVQTSMEMMHSNVLTRCWMEVRQLWVRFIMESTSTKLGRVTHGFF